MAIEYPWLAIAHNRVREVVRHHFRLTVSEYAGFRQRSAGHKWNAGDIADSVDAGKFRFERLPVHRHPARFTGQAGGTHHRRRAMRRDIGQQIKWNHHSTLEMNPPAGSIDLGDSLLGIDV